jgi:hypothetical protein
MIPLTPRTGQKKNRYINDKLCMREKERERKRESVELQPVIACNAIGQQKEGYSLHLRVWLRIPPLGAE